MHIAYDEGTAILMLLDAVDLKLAQVGKIAKRKSNTTNGNVECQQLTQREGIAKVCSTNIVVVVPPIEDVVITLSVLGHEGCTEEGQVCLIMQTKCLAFNLEAIVGTNKGREGYSNTCLSRIVAVSVVIEKAQIASCETTCCKVEI